MPTLSQFLLQTLVKLDYRTGRFKDSDCILYLVCLKLQEPCLDSVTFLYWYLAEDNLSHAQFREHLYFLISVFFLLFYLIAFLCRLSSRRYVHNLDFVNAINACQKSWRATRYKDYENFPLEELTRRAGGVYSRAPRYEGFLLCHKPYYCKESACICRGSF